MTIGELRAWMQSPPDVPVWKDDRHGRRIDNRWQRYFSARNVLISRFSLPLATLTFCLIAIPLAMEIRPQAKAFSALIAIGLLIVYYLLMTAGNTVGASGAGWITTIGAHMLPNIAIGTVGLVMFLRVSRH
jgi:lipopolysaccharide export system permease protein